MQGIWKEKVGGWDRKGQRRKSCSRKHILKDKVKIIFKLYAYGSYHDEDVYRVERGKEFVYNRPFSFTSYLHSHKIFTNHGNHYLVNSIRHKIRASERNWLAKEDWETERKFVPYEKSIDRLIY